MTIIFLIKFHSELTINVWSENVILGIFCKHAVLGHHITLPDPLQGKVGTPTV